MSDNASILSPSAIDPRTAANAAASRPLFWRRPWVRRAGTAQLVVLAAGAGYIGWTHLRQFPAAMLASLLILIVLGWAVGFLVAARRHERRWTRPLSRFEHALSQILESQATIEELSSVSGPLSPLAKQTQKLLGELRRQKSELSRLEREIGQRVAQRTDALERVIASLRHQASRDPLTGLNNRRMLDQHLPALVDRAKRMGLSMCLLMLDLDNFKCLNDTLGHGAGDDYLRTVGQIIRSSMRTDDLAFRYGGDEFVLVLQDSGEESARNLARRLSALIDAIARTLHTPKPLGLSAGIALLSRNPDATAAWLLDAADKDLYHVKAARKRPRGEPAGSKPAPAHAPVQSVVVRTIPLGEAKRP